MVSEAIVGVSKKTWKHEKGSSEKLVSAKLLRLRGIPRNHGGSGEILGTKNGHSASDYFRLKTHVFDVASDWKPLALAGTASEAKWIVCKKIKWQVTERAAVTDRLRVSPFFGTKHLTIIHKSFENTNKPK